MIRLLRLCFFLAALLFFGLRPLPAAADDNQTDAAETILAQARLDGRFNDARTLLLSRLDQSTISQDRIPIQIALANIELEMGHAGAARDLVNEVLVQINTPHDMAYAQETAGRVHMALGDFLTMGEAARDGLAQPVVWTTDIQHRRLHAALTFLLATEAQAAGRLDEAEVLHDQALAERRAMPDTPAHEILSSLNGLATLHYQRGQTEQAWPLMLEVAETARLQLQPGAPTRLTSQQNVLTMAVSTGRLAAAEDALRKIEAECNIVDAPFCTLGVMDFVRGGLLIRLGRPLEAEQAYARAISLAEVADSPNVSLLAQALNNLALTLKGRGAVVEAAEAFRRAHVLQATGAGPLNETTIRILGNRANALILTNQPALAEAELGAVIALALEAQTPPAGLGVLYARLAAALDAQGQGREALEAADRAIALTSSDSDRMHAHAARAQALSRLNRVAEALAEQRLALAQARRQKAPSNPELAYPLVTTARFLLKTGENAEALEKLNEAASILPAWLIARRTYSPNETGALTWSDLRDAVAELELEALWRLREHGGDAATLNAHAFQTAQRRLNGAGGDAMALAAARGLSDQPGVLSERVRDWENARQALTQADQTWSRLLGDGAVAAATREAALQNRQEAELHFQAADDALALTSNRFAAVRERSSVSLDRLRANLNADEAVMTFIITEEAVHVFTVTSGLVNWRRESISSGHLCEEVRALRLAIDADRVLECFTADRPHSVNTEHRVAADVLMQSTDSALHRGLEATFTHLDRARAHQLWRQLIAPDQAVLTDRKLIVATHGALASLPFSLLVTEPPTGADDDPDALRQTAWLLKAHAVASIPEPRLIPLLRARPIRSAEGFLGVGAPIGDLAPALPGAEQELRAMARRVASASPEGAITLLIGAEATKSRLQSLGLIERRVAVFATHGLTPGELGAVDYALLLSPEGDETANEGAILTASEIAGGLSLHVEWVVLSACNTVTLHGAGDAHSGLAKAFFASGARNLLLSHAPVRDDVAARLTEAVTAPGIDPVLALQHAALGLLFDTSAPDLAHPRHWAGFTIVGIDTTPDADHRH